MILIRTWATLTSSPRTRKVMVPNMWNRGNFLSVVISAVVLLIRFWKSKIKIWKT